MPYRRRAPDATLVADVWAELRAGKQITEAYLSHPKLVLEGLQMGKQVYVNPIPAVLEIALHEIIHRIKPRWGEKRVLIEANRIYFALSDTERRKWYRQYRKVAKVRNQPVRLTEEDI